MQTWLSRPRRIEEREAKSQDERLAADGRLEGGVLTPAAAMGMALVRRLQTAGFIFEMS